MRLGSDPRFKFVVSRAVYKGILRYISSQYGLPYVVQPLPVEAFSACFDASGATLLRWTPTVDSLEVTARPTGYVVYTRVDGGGFDNGRYVDRPQFAVEQEPGHIYSYRVTAVNAGGESFPSETLAACRVPDERGCVLIVNGFDRVSAPFASDIDSLTGFRRDIDFGVPDRRDISFIGAQRVFDRALARGTADSCALGACWHDFETEVLGGNTFDYPYLHGGPIAAAGYSFCSTSARAVERGEVAFDDYRTVDLGSSAAAPHRGGTRCARGGVRSISACVAGCLAPLCGAARGAVRLGMLRDERPCRRRGGALLRPGGAALRLRRISSRARRASADGGRATLLHARGVPHLRHAGRRPLLYGDDRCVATGGRGAFSVLRYLDDGRTACVASDDAGKSVVLGFPFASLTDRRQRDRLMRDVLRFLEPEK